MTKSKCYNADIVYPSPEECHRISRASKKSAFENFRAQRQYAGDIWELTFEEYETVWTNELHSFAGRGKDRWTIHRINSKLPWTLSNLTLAQIANITK